MEKAQYQPEIDGLRAIAVISVVMFHAGLGFPGGYIGVDIFFVISGYLITGIISRSIAKDRFSLVEFWERRIRRIFPALSTTILLTLLIGYFLLLPNDFLDLGKATLAQAALLANVYFWHSTGYFEGPAELKPLLHTWSLAVEEQFYIIFPLLLFAIRSDSIRFRIILLGCLAAFSLSASILGSGMFQSAAFFLLPARAWELLAGSLLAIVPQSGSRSKYRNEVMSLAGFLSIGASIALFDRETAFPGYAALLPVSGTVLLIRSLSGPKTAVAWLLSLKPVVFVGLISYSIYLLHWPVFAYGRYIMGSVSQKQAIIMTGMTLGLAYLSWRFVERPFREKKLAASRPAIFTFSAFITIGFFCLAFLILQSNGIPSRYPPGLSTQVDDVSWKGLEYMVDPSDDPSHVILPELGAKSHASSRLDFVLWGDSHGAVMASLLDQVATKKGILGVAFNSVGAPPVPGLWIPDKETTELNARHRSDWVMNFLRKSGAGNLILVGRWSAYCAGFSESELLNEPHRRKWKTLVTDRHHGEESIQESTRAFRDSMAALAAACDASGVNLWVIKEVPETGETECARRFVLWKKSPWLFDAPDRTLPFKEYLDRQRGPMHAFQSLEFTNVRILDPSPEFFNELGRTINYLDGRSIYRDNDHLTKAGTELLRPMIEDMFDEMLTKKQGAPIEN